MKHKSASVSISAELRCPPSCPIALRDRCRAWPGSDIAGVSPVVYGSPTSRSKNFKFSILENLDSQSRENSITEKSFRSIADRATFRRRLVENVQTCRKLAEGSRASALLSFRSSLSPTLAAGHPWYTHPTPGLSRGEPQRAEGQSRHACDGYMRA